MNEDNNDYLDTDDGAAGQIAKSDPISKSEKKRQMHALQAMGEELLTLSEEQMASIPLTPELDKALAEARRIKSREGLRRQMQYIGKLMRAADSQAIAEALQARKDQQDRMARALHMMERWRDELIDGDDAKTAEFVSRFPAVDVQQLRTLIRNARLEKARQKPPASARKLFKLIREQVAAF